MIFKVLYQSVIEDAPVRERTQVLYVEADSIKDARKKLQDREINIEFIQALDDAHLAYERKSEDFEVEKV